MSRPLDKEYIRLLHDVQSEHIPGHIYRGFTIKSKYNTAETSMDFQVNLDYIYFFVKLLINNYMCLYLVLFW